MTQKDDAFPVTQGTLLDGLLAKGESGRPERNRHVMERYLLPLKIYCRGTPFLRNLGDPEETIHDFFANRLSPEQRLLEKWKATVPQPRLRRWLMNALFFYAHEKYAEKSRELVPLWPFPESGVRAGNITIDEEKVLDRLWAIHMVQKALSETRQACEEAKQALHWQVFYKHYVDGLAYADFVKALQLTPRSAHTKARTVAAKFRQSLCELLLGDGTSKDKLNQEICNLLAIIGDHQADPQQDGSAEDLTATRLLPVALNGLDRAEQRLLDYLNEVEDPQAALEGILQGAQFAADQPQSGKLVLAELEDRLLGGRAALGELEEIYYHKAKILMATKPSIVEGLDAPSNRLQLAGLLVFLLSLAAAQAHFGKWLSKSKNKAAVAPAFHELTEILTPKWAALIRKALQ